MVYVVLISMKPKVSSMGQPDLLALSMVYTRSDSATQTNLLLLQVLLVVS